MKHFFKHTSLLGLMILLCGGGVYAQAPRCDITAVTAGAQACGPQVDYYAQEIIVDYVDPPADGTLLVEINGNSEFLSFPITSSPQSIWLENLPADGQAVDIFVKFSEDNGCTWLVRDLFTAPADCSEPMAFVQLIHNAPDPNLTPVDIYLTEDVAIDPQSTLFDDVTFKTATACLPVMPGDYILGFARANSLGPEDVLLEFPFTFAKGEKYILMASGVATPGDFDETVNPGMIGFDVKSFTPGQSAASLPGNVDLLAFHGSPDAPTVDVLANDGLPPLIDDLVYGTFQGYLSVPAAAYKLSITPGGDNATVVEDFYADLSPLAGGAAVVFASGFLNPAANQGGPAFSLCAALTDGTVIDLPPYVACEITSVEAGEYLGCDPDDETYDQEIIVTYATDPAEAGDLMIELDGSGEYITVAATGSPQTIVLEDLPIDGRGAEVDVKVKFSNAAPPCYLGVRDLFTAPRHCRCDITDLRLGRQSACDFRTETYSQQIIVEYINEPSTGYLQVELNGNSEFINYPITGSPQTILLEDLEGNGEMVDVFVKFSDTDNCTWTERDFFQAANCRPCVIRDVEAGAQLDCDEDTERYSQELIITYHDAPTTGELLLYLNGRGPLTYPITGSPQTVVVENIPTDMTTYDVEVNFTDKDCPYTEHEVFTAPEGCACEIVDIEAGHQSDCDPHTNLYTQELVVTYKNPPATGHLLVELNDSDHYLEYEITGSPQTILLEDLLSDNQYVDVEVKFSEDRHCVLAEHDVFRAPEPCLPKILSYTLIDAETDMAVPGYDPIPDGAVINLFRMPTANLSIRANTEPEVVGSVRFHLEGSFDFNRLEEEFPYALFGDIDADYFEPDQPFEAGQSFMLEGTPYSRADAMGAMGETVPLNFSFVFNIPPMVSLDIASPDTLAYPADSTRICGLATDSDGMIDSVSWAQVSGPGMATLDTLIRVDTTIQMDTVITPDTIISMDSTFTSDTTIVMDTLVDMDGMDSIVMDTTIVMDTLVMNDTTINMDTTINTILLTDSLVCLDATELVPGTYVFRFCAVDDGGESSCTDISVVVLPPPGPRVLSFTLIDADSDVPIPDYDPLMDGASIDLASLPTTNLSIRANAADGATEAVASVRMELTGSFSHTQTENVAPYALFGDNSGNYTGRMDLAAAGNAFTLSGTAFVGGGASGNAGETLTIDFSFVDAGGRTQPTSMPGGLSAFARGRVHVYPNPSNGQFNVMALPANDQQQLGQARLYVINGLGQVVKEQLIQEGIEQAVRLPVRTEGLYIIRIEGDGYMAMDKLLIEN